MYRFGSSQKHNSGALLYLALFCSILTIASGLANGVMFTLLYFLDKVSITEPNIPWRTIEMCVAWVIFVVGVVTAILLFRRLLNNYDEDKKE
jgi:uncharacterized membrane protein YecN with MAPEG domain